VGEGGLSIIAASYRIAPHYALWSSKSMNKDIYAGNEQKT
jgi:hypothetical protein